MQLTAVRAFVDDLAKAQVFYAETLGLKILWEYKDVAVGFDAGPGVLIIEKEEPEAEPNAAPAGRFKGFWVSLRCADVAASYAELSAKSVEFLAPPEKMDWGGTLAHFKDPSGNVLTLVS